MSGVQYEVSEQRQFIQCMSTIADFHAVPCEVARSIQGTLKVRKCFSTLGQASDSCRDDRFHVHTSEDRRNSNDCLKDLSLSRNTFFLKDSKLRSTFVLDNVYDISGLEPLHN